jgi:hypothetical protein
VRQINVLKKTLEEQAPQYRLATLEEFKNILYDRLNSIPMPEDISKVPDNDPRIEEFRSLNEFSGYLNLMTPKTLSAASCRSARKDLVNSVDTQGAELSEETVASDDSVPSEAIQAMKILKSLCK